MANGFIPIYCPDCKKKLMEAPARMNQNCTRVCSGCKQRFRIDWDWKTQYAHVKYA